MTTARRIGILGGTFDPPHAGHLRIAKAALRQLRLDALFLVPARMAPHKQQRRPAAMRHRVAMVRAMTRRIPRVHVSEMEIRRPGVSFTVDTVAAFRRRFPNAELFLIVGGDSLADFHGWKDPDRIRAMATLAVYLRNGSRLVSGARRLSGPRLAVSSTDVRMRLTAGQGTERLLPKAVARYIRQHRLYRRARGYSHAVQIAEHHRAHR